MIAQKYRLNFLQQMKLAPEVNRALGQQFANADEMFETLFTEVRRLATLLGAGLEDGMGNGGGGMAAGYWTVLTDGDPVETDLIFADSEAIAVWVPTS